MTLNELQSFSCTRQMTTTLNAQPRWAAAQSFCNVQALQLKRPRVTLRIPLKPVQHVLSHSRSHRAQQVCMSASPDEEVKPSSSPAPGFAVWGPPGSGKSTLCEMLNHSHGLVHINAGSLLRAHVLYETDWGIRAAPYLRERIRVPDSILVPILLERLRQVDCATHGFLLDAFPRNPKQEAALLAAGFRFEIAIMLHAPREILESRLRHRRLDPETDLLYNLKYRPPGSQEVLERLVVLDKDRDSNYAELFAKYGRCAAEMFDASSQHCLRIDANRELSEVVKDITRALRSKGAAPLKKVGARAPHLRIPDIIGDASNGAPTRLNGRNAALASAAMRASDSDNSKESRNAKAPITLVRCDGYMCERESVDHSNIAFRGAATEQVMLVWNERPKVVLLLVKKDPSLMSSVLEAANYLMNEENMKVIVEPRVQSQALTNGLYLDTFSKQDVLSEKADFVVCLGGDGLILHVSTLFENAVPPVISFNLGSLGFLTPFAFVNFKEEIRQLLQDECKLSLRMRLSCSIIRQGQVEKELQVLNEVVVDRGASPYLSNLDCYCDGKYITTVQADGIIMSTPTGSTAYSMSAGGSMVHPSVPAILFTPICPHSLSFRPIVFPDAAKLRIEISEDARSHAWASFDGKSRQQLRRGDGLLVQMNMYPVPTVNKTDHTGDWFQSLDRAFNFNSRAIQKPLPPLRYRGDSLDADLAESVEPNESEELNGSSLSDEGDPLSDDNGLTANDDASDFGNGEEEIPTQLDVGSKLTTAE